MLKINLCTAVLTVFVMAFSLSVAADPYSVGGHYHSHSGFGFYLGFPLFPRFYYPYYPFPYYPPQIVTAPANPPVYIERSARRSLPPFPRGYWYYCSNPEGYYPYVKECSIGWLQVDPIPPSLK